MTQLAIDAEHAGTKLRTARLTFQEHDDPELRVIKCELEDLTRYITVPASVIPHLTRALHRSDDPGVTFLHFVRKLTECGLAS